MESGPHTRRFADDEPVALAKDAIRLLEDHLAATYGLAVECGAELEFAVQIPPGQHRDAWRYGVPYGDAAKVHGTESSAAKHFFHKSPWFPDSRRITYGYRESSGYGRHVKLEAVLTHDPSTANGTPVAQSALDLARNVEALRYQLLNPAPGYKHDGMPAQHPLRYAATHTARAAKALFHTLAPGQPPETNHAYQAAHWQKFRRERLTDLEFSRMLPESGAEEAMTLGLHFNASLIDASGNCAHPTREMTRILAQSCLETADEGNYLMTASTSNWQRLRERTGHFIPEIARDIYARQVRVAEGHSGFYIENRMPPADCNPYYAVMLQLLGIERGLRRQHFRRTGSGYTMDAAGPATMPQAPDSPDQMQARFHQADLRDQMNGLEDGLGDRFYAAIAHCPPGTERTAMDKRHAERGERLR